jgi:hypothetical protein
LPESQKRSARTVVRFTPREAKELARLAKVRGFTCVADLLYHSSQKELRESKSDVQ